MEELINGTTSHTVELKKAFNLLFEKDWSLSPYYSHDDSSLPCVKFQGKWELDKTLYFLEFPLVNGYGYSVPKSIDFYTWCRLDNKMKGETLEGLEFLTNSIYKTNRKIHSLADLYTEKPIGEISGLFLDTINFNQSSPKREGRRIGRYRAVMYKNNDEFTEQDKIANKRAIEVVTESLREIKAPECPVNIENYNGEKDLRKNETIMIFECIYKAKNGSKENQPYNKRLVYKGNAS